MEILILLWDSLIGRVLEYSGAAQNKWALEYSSHYECNAKKETSFLEPSYAIVRGRTGWGGSVQHLRRAGVGVFVALPMLE